MKFLKKILKTNLSKTFLSITLSILSSSISYALECNRNYVSNSNLDVRLNPSELDQFKNLNSILSAKDISITKTEFVLIQAISSEAESNESMHAQIASTEFTHQTIKELNEIKRGVLNGAFIVPSNTVKTRILKTLDLNLELAESAITIKASDVRYVNAFLIYSNSTMSIIHKNLKITCGLDLSEMTAINLYTNYLYSHINKIFRADDSRNFVQNLKKIFNRSLDKIAPYVGIVLRGSNLKEPYLSEHFVGNTLTYKGLTSTSIGVPFQAEYQFQINSLSGRDISDFSSHPEEKEVLFKTDTRFTIIEKHGNTFKMKEAVNL